VVWSNNKHTERAREAERSQEEERWRAGMLEELAEVAKTNAEERPSPPLDMAA
jgi:hypothetical protein